MPNKKPHKSMWKKDLSRVLIVVALFLGVLLLLRLEPVRENLFDITRLRDSLHPDDSPIRQFRSSVIFLFVGAFLVGLGMPRLWVSAAAGGVFGAFLGIILALGSTLLGALMTYVVGRSLLGSIIRRRLGRHRRFALLQSHLAQNAFFFTLSMRLFPFSNTTITSLFCGSCKVPIAPYLLATFLGFLPLTIAFVFFGSGVAKAEYPQFLAGIVLFLIAILLQRRLAPYFNREVRRQPAAAHPESVSGDGDRA